MGARMYASRMGEIGDAKPFLDEDVYTVILENAGNFAEQMLSSFPSLGDDIAVSRFDRRRETYKAIFNEAWSGVSLSQEQGGLGLPTTLRAPLLEIIGSADAELWHYIDTSMLISGLISSLAGLALRKHFIPRLSAGDWVVSLDMAVVHASPVRIRAFQQGNGEFRLVGASDGSGTTPGLAAAEFRLVKAMICRDDDAPVDPALFLVPVCVPGDDDGSYVSGWYVASMQSAQPELARLKHAIILRASIAVIARKPRDLNACEMDAWRAASLAYACALDLEEKHTDEKVRQDNNRYVRITSKILEFWVQDNQPISTGSKSLIDSLVEDEILPDGGAAFRSWLNRVYQTVNRLDGRLFAGSEDLGRSLRGGAESLQLVVDDVLANYMPSPGVTLDSSEVILSLFAKVLVCTEIANDALYAAQCVSSGRWNATYLNGKIQAALHFVAQELPGSRRWLPAVA